MSDIMGRTFQQLGGMALDQFERQQKMLEQTQISQAQANLHTSLREAERNYEQKLNERLAQSMDIGTEGFQDILSPEGFESWYEETVTEIFEKSGAGISTPGARAQWDNSMREMESRYRESWRDKQTSALQQWNRSQIAPTIQGIIEMNLDKEEAYSEIQKYVQESLSSGTILPPEADQLLRDTKLQVGAYELFEFIQDPRDEDQGMFESFQKEQDAISKKIEELANDGWIDRSTRERGRQAMEDRLRNEQQRGMAYLQNTNTQWLLQNIRGLANAGRSPQDIYRMQVNYAMDQSEWGLLTSQQQQQVLTFLNVQTSRLYQVEEVEQDGQASQRLPPPERILENYASAAVNDMRSINTEEGLIQFRDEFLQELREYGRDLNTEERHIESIYRNFERQSYEILEQFRSPYRGQERSQPVQRFVENLKQRGINNPAALQLFEKELLMESGNWMSDGRNTITNNHVDNVLQRFDMGKLENALTTRERAGGRPVVNVLNRRGYQLQEAAEVIGAITAVSRAPLVRGIAATSRAFGSFTSANGTVDVDRLREAVRIEYGVEPGVEPAEDINTFIEASVTAAVAAMEIGHGVALARSSVNLPGEGAFETVLGTNHHIADDGGIIYHVLHRHQDGREIDTYIKVNPIDQEVRRGLIGPGTKQEIMGQPLSLLPDGNFVPISGARYMMTDMENALRGNRGPAGIQGR